MSPENTNPPPPPSATLPPATTETRPPEKGRASSYLHSLNKADQNTSASSAPSADSEWVSPFTLPALPALQRNQNQPIKSPEHRRTNSNLFYAAAWGSPYASTPSPKVRSPGSGGHSAGKSLDSAAPVSPLRIGGDWIQSLSARLYGTKPAAAELDLPDRIGSRSPQKGQSERSHWLSDSEESDVEALPGEEPERTPTRPLLSKLRAGSFGNNFAHRNQESTTTVTPENFNVQARPPPPFKALSTTEVSNMAAVGTMHERFSGEPESPEKEKPLPLLPARRTSSSQVSAALGSPTSPHRPRLGSMQSFQRPKRQVMWRGKKCIIALPLSSREEAGLPSLMSPTDIKIRLQKWKQEGYNTDGFVLGDSLDSEYSQGTGHSRPVYPDSRDNSRERQQRNFQISVPDQAEWDAWVNLLKEEKLRALGVSSSNSEPPASTKSPFSSSMSPVSSQHPGHVVSPLNAPSSVASMPMRLGSNPFSPPFLPSTGASSQAASLPSPPAYSQVGPKPLMDPRMVSPFNQGQIAQSPPSYFAQHSMNVSPTGIGSLPSLGEVLSPVSPFNVDDFIPQHQTDPLVQQVRQQQSAKASPVVPVALPSTPQNEPPSVPLFEIAHPTPRSHRHNLSEALQKGVDDAEMSYKGGEKDARDAQDVEEKEREDDEEALPILKRPETLLHDEENADIITNPSNEPSPAPREERDPLANWPVTLKSQDSRGHKTQPSAAKFNVEAPPFDPKGNFTPSQFSFGAPAFQPSLPKAAGFQPARAVDQKPFSFAPASSQLKPDAPAFTPSFASQTPPSSKSFTFSAASFNVEAPEFNPAAPPNENFKTSVGSASESDRPNTRIFGDVVIDPLAKAERRSTKVLPIVRPRSKDGPQDSLDEARESEEDEDDQGRPQAPAERQKRMRRGGSDGDRTPEFASSAPFTHSNILSEIINDADKMKGSVERLESPENKGVRDTPEVAHPEDDADVENRPPPSAHTDASSTNPWSPFAFRTSRDAIDFDSARPVGQRSRDASKELKEGTDSEELPKDVSSDTPLKSTEIVDTDSPAVDSNDDAKSKTTLSGAAPPFGLSPPAATEPIQEVRKVSQPKKQTGLMASRFAPSPSPPSSPSSSRQNMSSPPSEMYSYIKPEDVSELGIRVKEDVSEHVSSSPRIEERRPTNDDEIIVEIDETDNERKDRSRSMSISVTSDHPADAVPSYEEIDAVMKHLDENPELGVERTVTPPVLSTPLIDMRLPPNFRSDAPSPSPRRIQRVERRSHSENAADDHPFGLGIGIHKLTDGTETVSDWNGAMSPSQEEKLQSRARFFDGHVNDLVDNILETRLGPLESTLKSIQQSITSLAGRSRSQHGRRSMSTDVKESDADDEDDYDAFEGYVDYRTRSPVSKRGVRPDRIKQAVMEAMAVHKPTPPVESQVDLSEVHTALAEMRELARQTKPESKSADLRGIVEDVIATHPRLRGQRFQRSPESEEKYKLQVNGLEAMLKVANERLDEEARQRREAEAEVADLTHRLRASEEEAAQHREASEEVERSLHSFVRKKDSYENLEQNVSEFEEENKALKKTLDEYRESHDHWQDEIRRLKERNHDLEDEADQDRQSADEQLQEELRSLRREREDLQHALIHAKDQLHERTRSREAYRDTVERLRGEVSNLVHSIASERSEWQKVDHEMRVNHSTMSSTLEQERRRREKIESELEDLYKDHHETLQLRTSHAHAQEEIARLQALVATLREESKTHQESSFKSERELTVVKDTLETEVTKATAQMQADLERANSHLANARSDSDAQISRLQNRLDTAELDLEEQKANHEAVFSETIEAHKQTLQEAVEKRETALEEQRSTHDRKLNDLRERHTRALHNSSDDRHRLEHHLNEKLNLSEDKVKYLEAKLIDLEERLQITKSAARAAVEAVTKKGIDLPTPANSTMASPPNHPSLSFIRGTELPEKISPQALRESIMVLQDQLQNREQTIEKLEQEVAVIDKDAPRKMLGLETEVSWLRELLNVRVDDIDELVRVLTVDTNESFDRNAAKDAAIRLKANIAMETQIRERAMSATSALSGIANNLPTSLASLSTTLSQSPRAFPLAAAAAWGNWRKARDFSSIGSSFSDLTTAVAGSGVKQTAAAAPSTPTRSPAGSTSFLSSLASPSPAGGLNLKSPDSTPMPAPRPLAGFGPARKGSVGSSTSETPSLPGPVRSMSRDTGTGTSTPRPLRAYGSQPRALGGKTRVSPPSASAAVRDDNDASGGGGGLETPMAIRRMMSPASEFGEDVDEDATSIS